MEDTNGKSSVTAPAPPATSGATPSGSGVSGQKRKGDDSSSPVPSKKSKSDR